MTRAARPVPYPDLPWGRFLGAVAGVMPKTAPLELPDRWVSHEPDAWATDVRLRVAIKTYLRDRGRRTGRRQELVAVTGVDYSRVAGRGLVTRFETDPLWSFDPAAPDIDEAGHREPCDICPSGTPYDHETWCPARKTS